jgi:hypothetical protein
LPLIESTKEASKGGFQGIKKVRGLLVKMSDDPIPPPESWETTKLQVQVFLEDCTVLEMFPGEENFELNEGKYNFYIAYADPGKKPHSSSAYMKCWVASAEKMGKKPSDFIGQYVTLEKIKTKLFDQRNKETKELEPVYSENCFSFVQDETASSDNVKAYITDLVVGLNRKAALRKLITDTRAKQFPEYKDMLSKGTLAAELGFTIGDDEQAKFEKVA